MKCSCFNVRKVVEVDKTLLLMQFSKFRLFTSLFLAVSYAACLYYLLQSRLEVQYKFAMYNHIQCVPATCPVFLG